MDLGRFTSPLGQTVNIDKVCHNKKQTEPKKKKIENSRGEDFMKMYQYTKSKYQ